MTMMHGVIYGNYGYTPLLSDVGLCWGRQHVEQLIEQGVEPERLVITGCQRLVRTPQVPGKVVRARLGIPLDVPVIMLATGPMPREEWRKLLSAFGEAFEGHPGVSAVVRLHASEKLDHYKEEVSHYRGIRFFENCEWTVEEAMAACDVVVIHNSGLGNDALVFRRLVVLLDALALPLSNGRTLASEAGSPVARTAAELRQIVDRMLTDADHRQKLQHQAEAYVNRFCAAFGRDAAHNVAAEVEKRANLMAPVTFGSRGAIRSEDVDG